MASAVLAVIVLTLLLPSALSPIHARWVVPTIEGILLAALIIGDPGAIDRRSRLLQRLSVGLVAVLVIGALLSTGFLIAELIDGGSATDTAGELLAAGAIVWIVNNIAFSLLYWQLDCGGAAARAHRMPAHPDIVFPQQMNPELAPPDWRPQFVDYLYLGFTNATAFSPTDAMPYAPRVKVAMAAQAVASLAILGLVIARAVNVFS